MVEFRKINILSREAEGTGPATPGNLYYYKVLLPAKAVPLKDEKCLPQSASYFEDFLFVKE